MMSMTFTIVGNRGPLTRITSTKVVPTRETFTKSVATPTQGILVYSMRPKATRCVVQIFLWYLDSGCSKHMTGNRSELISFVSKFWGAVRFGNDHIAKIMGYGDYQMGNVTISRVYYVEGLGHNLFSVGQFCDFDLEVAFRKHACFIRDLDVPAVIAYEPVVSTGIPSSTTIDQNAPSSSTSQITSETSPLVIPLSVEEADHDIKVAHMDNNPFVEFLIPETSFEESSTQVVILNHVHSINQPPHR
nr:integrase, catalytic region, zinc finger, CCHC-type, peptidase aspartic, catalytic [Tanacetum cinerariifolium]